MSRSFSKMLPKSFEDIAVFSRFFAVGAVGFTVDFLVLSFCVYVLGLSPIWSRLPSASVAICVTWFLNMRFTFRANPASKKKSLVFYALVKGAGFLINFGIYTALFYTHPFFATYLIVPLAIGSGIAMIFNFIFARFVFEKV